MTIKDIARAANVSPATVSRIINHKDGNISEETRQRVLRVIEENDYIPYAKIRERILFQSRSIGLLIPTLNSAFYMRLASEVQQLAQEHGYSLVLALSSGSTDANIPMSQGIPAISFGFCRSRGEHTLQESLDIDTFPAGMIQMLEFMGM